MKLGYKDIIFFNIELNLYAFDAFYSKNQY